MMLLGLRKMKLDPVKAGRSIIWFGFTWHKGKQVGRKVKSTLAILQRGGYGKS